MNIYDALKKNFIISSDKSKLDVDSIHHYLSTVSYWAKNIPVEMVKKSIAGSFCFGVYKKENGGATVQIGFARVITDHATFGYLADVFILEPYRGIGISKWLMYEILSHPELQGFRSWMLGTKDAHGLYEQFGFMRITHSERLMRLGLLEAYPVL